MLDKHIGKLIQITTEYQGHVGILLDYSPIGILVRLTEVGSSNHPFYKEDDTVFFSYTNLAFKLM